jgi:hypothetical protein
LFQFKNKNILILSPEDWGDNLLSKHLYAKELSIRNKVYFIHTSPHKSQKEFIQQTILSETLTVIHLKNIAKGISKLPSFLIDIQNYFLIQKILKNIKLNKIDVIWSFDQSKFQKLTQFQADKKIFHPVDFIEKAKKYRTRIANSADIVLSVSKVILQEIQTSTPKFFINHGLDEIFTLKNNSSNPPPTFISNKKINVGYVGNLQMKFIDWDILIATIELNPTINFVFIGPDKKSNIGGSVKFNQIEKIKSLKNTFFTGPLSKIDLQKTLSFFDIFLICYNHNKFPIEVSNSHKILEYLSTGKIILSNYISTYKGSSLLEMVEHNSLIPEKLSFIAENLNNYNNLENESERIHYALDNSYIKQIERVEKILNR